MGKSVGPEDTNSVRKAIALLGDSGVGKSSLAATAKLPYVIDIETRAEHLGVPRYIPDQDENGWKDLIDFIKELKTAKRLPGFGLKIRGYDAETLVLDTLDRMQELFRMQAPKWLLEPKNKQKFYGALLDGALQDVLFPIFALPINLVFIAHSAEKSLDAVEQEVVKDQSTKIAPTTTFALEGQLRNRLPNYFDNILHMIRKQDGSTVILTTSQLYEGRFLIAKDKKWLFGGKTIPVVWKNGKIADDTMRKIFDQMTVASGKQLSPREKVRVALLDHAVTVGIMKDPQDAVGGQKIKLNVMAKLEPALADLTEAGVTDMIKQGKELIDQLNIDLAKVVPA